VKNNQLLEEQIIEFDLPGERLILYCKIIGSQK